MPRLPPEFDRAQALHFLALAAAQLEAAAQSTKVARDLLTRAGAHPVNEPAMRKLAEVAEALARLGVNLRARVRTGR